MSKAKEISTKKVSRRDALKLLTAVAGATALANTPARWSKPELKVGVLPVHAQTSITNPHTLAAGPDNNGTNYCQPFNSTATITPPDSGISLRYAIVLSNSQTQLTTPALLNGTISTDSSGGVSLTIAVNSNSPFNTGDTITVTWSFTNPADGTGSDSQVFTSSSNGCAVLHTITTGNDDFANFCGEQIPLTSTATINPIAQGIILRFTITSTNVAVVPPLTGTVSTDSSGAASVSFLATGTGTPDDMVVVAWSFENPSDGTTSASQTFSAGGC